MLGPIALALSILALLLAGGALAMIIKQKKEFQSLLSTVRRLEDSKTAEPAPVPVARPQPAQLPAASAPEPEIERSTPTEPEPAAASQPRPEPTPQSAETEPTPRSAGTEPQPDLEPRSAGAEPAEPSPPAPAAKPRPAPAAEPERPTPAKPAQPDPDPAWQAWLEQLRALPHGAVASLLGEVLQHSKHLARGFADTAHRSAFEREVAEGFQRRLTRFQQCARDEATFVERWVEPDLVTALDILARFQSLAAADARDGHTPAAQLASWLAGALYDQLGPACQDEGWFALERIEPFRSEFDPQRHKGIDGRIVAGARGLVVEVERVGRMHPVEGYPLDKAHVVVGR